MLAYHGFTCGCITSFEASILGQPEIMVALYGAGADVDAEDLAGLTALHCAVRDARLETVRRGDDWLDAGNEQFGNPITKFQIQRILVVYDMVYVAVWEHV